MPSDNAAVPPTRRPVSLLPQRRASHSPPAETASTGAREHHWYQAGALGYMLDGGLFMWPILLMGILAAGVTIERWRSLKMLDVDTSPLRNEVLRTAARRPGRRSPRTVPGQQGPVPAVLAAGIRKICCSSGSIMIRARSKPRSTRRWKITASTSWRPGTEPADPGHGVQRGADGGLGRHGDGHDHLVRATSWPNTARSTSFWPPRPASSSSCWSPSGD